MVDIVGSAASIEERDDLGKGDAGLFAYWATQEKIAEKELGNWPKRAKAIVKRYRDDRPEAGATRVQFNILWSNVQTLLPTLYARTPKPQVDRRFKDPDPTGKLAAMLLERCCSYSVEMHGFDDAMKATVEDRLLPGRGVSRVLYIPHFGDPIQDEAEAVDNAGDQAKPEASPELTKTQAMPEPAREVVWEEARVEYIFWEDYLEGPARKWAHVPWIRYRAYMTRDELEKRFGRDKAMQVQLDVTPKGTDNKGDEPADIYKKAAIHEVWDKTKAEVVWYAPSTPDVILDRKSDPLGLKGFFPNADPLFATTTNDKRVPVPDYTEYQDQARQLDSLTQRIQLLQNACKVAGVYPATAKQELQQLIDEGTENRLIPVEDWAAFGDLTGKTGMIVWLPIQQIAEVMIQLGNQQEKTIQQIYQITGISDIMRGSTSPVETASAQQLKANFSQARIAPQQKEVARFARDTIRLVAGIVSSHFSGQTISQITGYPQLKPVPQLPAPPQPPMAPLAPPQGGPMQQAQQGPATQPPMPGGASPVMGGAPPPDPAQQAYAQAMQAYQAEAAQYQQAAQAQQAVMAENAKLQEQFDAAVALLKQDALTSFRVDIEADSTIAADDQQEKQDRTEFLSELINMMQQVVPIAQGNPALAELAKQATLFGVRGYRVGAQLEETIEKAFDDIGRQPPHPSQLPKGGAPAQGAQSNADSSADLALRAQENSTQAQADEGKNAAAMAAVGVKQRQVEADTAIAAEKLHQAERFHADDMAVEAQRLEDQRQVHAARMTQMAERGAQGLT